jgi:uncharacterized protein (DUF1499 family)
VGFSRADEIVSGRLTDAASKQLIKIGLVLSVIAAGLLLAGSLGSRAGLWPFTIGFLLLAASVLLALVGASLSLTGGIKTAQWASAGAGVAIGLAVVAVPGAFILSARGKPAIHDITTDPDNPPVFVAILPLRAGAANPPEYAGSEAAAQQRRAYPDIQPLTLRVAREEAFDRSLRAVQDLGLDIVAADRASGRIEAVDTTFWFGFKDDVVIRITGSPADEGARVDLRSKSRVGVGDLGTNARRIRNLLERLQSGS